MELEQILPESWYTKEFCEVCEDESDNLNWSVNDSLVCSYCLDQGVA